MILREQRDETLLIPQAERCRVADTLASRVGNNQFDALSPSVRAATRWIDRAIDDALTTPTDVRQLERAAQMTLWERSSREAAAIDPYAGLLLALRGFWNSIQAGTGSQTQWQDDSTRLRFDLNRFQHMMIELLEALRQQCGLRIDRPLKYGLAENTRDPRERRLRSDFEWLGLLAELSESVCRATPPITALSARPRGLGRPVAFTLEVSDTRLLLHPWPFDRARIELIVEARSVSRRDSPMELVALPHKTFAIELGPLTI